MKETPTVAEQTETEPKTQKIELADDGSGSSSDFLINERGNMTADDCTIRGG